jgi:hypothetical protein
VQGIVVLLSKDLLKPVLIATCIALPVGYYAMNKWLQSFAYQTTLSWWVFVLAACNNIRYCVCNSWYQGDQSSNNKSCEKFENRVI